MTISSPSQLSPAQLLARYSLKPDTGWPSNAFEILAASSCQSAWINLFDHLSTYTVSKTDQQQTETLCFSDPSLYPEHPTPGSDAFHNALIAARPSQSWLDKTSSLLAAIDPVSLQKASSFIRSASQSRIGYLNRPGPNRDLLHALLGSTLCMPCSESIDALRQLAAATAGKTIQAVTILLILGLHESQHALASLHLLAQQAKRPTPRDRARRLAIHLERRLHISADDAAERFIPTFDFDANAHRTIPIADHFAQLQIVGRSVALHFLNPLKQEIKALPARVKKNAAPSIKEVKDTIKSVDNLLAAQSARIESFFLNPRTWSIADFTECYIRHPLLAALANKLLWRIGANPAFLLDSKWFDSSKKEIFPSPHDTVSLWHPSMSAPNEILSWRKFLNDNQIVQPFKQIHREIYLLTDAERATHSYSNRFAAHILRQHQFNQLAKLRQWDYSLAGVWDTSSTVTATRTIPHANLRAEFWVTPLDADLTERGIAMLVSTDQVRFSRPDSPHPIPLDQVPPLVLSEALRDVDLFVGVCSVANDPTWNDGGPDGRFREYWHDYSFGDLSATAQTRKTVLESLLPRLAIAPQCALSDKFLLVKGTKRTYKIHLGSGNILMEPNDQYLCIVPDSSARNASASQNLYLPFEGDNVLSIILSKALLLASDQKITDPSILSQINRT